MKPSSALHRATSENQWRNGTLSRAFADKSNTETSSLEVKALQNQTRVRPPARKPGDRTLAIQQTQPAASTGAFRCGPGSIPERGRAIEPVQLARVNVNLPFQMMMGHRWSRDDHAETMQNCILGSPVRHLLSQVDTRFHDNAIDSGITGCAGRSLAFPLLPPQ